MSGTDLLGGNIEWTKPGLCFKLATCATSMVKVTKPCATSGVSGTACRMHSTLWLEDRQWSVASQWIGRSSGGDVEHAREVVVFCNQLFCLVLARQRLCQVP